MSSIVRSPNCSGNRPYRTGFGLTCQWAGFNLFSQNDFVPPGVQFE